MEPADLVGLAVDKGLNSLALTDHDTLQGVQAAVEAASDTGLDLIPGTELSLEFDRGGMHLLVLWLSPGSGPLQRDGPVAMIRS